MAEGRHIGKIKKCDISTGSTNLHKLGFSDAMLAS